jgi:tetraacyldisaccharide 4'-kinase
MQSTYADIGDEPVQIKQKFPDIIVAVDEDRRRGIRNLLALPVPERPEVILLDDGFQHRYVNPSFVILLTSFNRMFYDDKLLPVGRLREPPGAILEADMVIVTKCRKDMKPIEYRIIEEHMHLFAHQEVFFTQVSYLEITPLFPAFAHRRVKRDSRKDDDVLVLSGIAYPEDLIDEIRK